MKNSKLLEMFVEHVCSTRSLSDYTKAAYKNDLVQINKTLENGKLFIDLSPDDIISLLKKFDSSTSLKKSTIKRRIATLKQFYKWLSSNDYIKRNPIEKLQLTVRLPKQLPKWLSKKEISKILLCTEHITINPTPYKICLLKFIFNFLFISGVRVGELVNIKLQDVCIEEACILIHGKGNRERNVYLSGDNIKYILNMLLRKRYQLGIEDDYLLVLEDGRRVSSQYIRRYFKKAAQFSGIDKNITPHIMRHTTATQLVESGIDIRLIQRLLGHASISTTEIYTHVRDSSLMLALEKVNLLAKLGDVMKDN